MIRHSFVLADVRRVEQFGIIGASPKLMAGAAIHLDGQGLAWAVQRNARHCFAVTWPGSNRIFDPEAVRQRHHEWESAHSEIARADEGEQRRRIAATVSRFRVGPRAERLLWHMHSRILDQRRSVVTLADLELAEAVWGIARDCWPVHWRREITQLLKALSRLHVAQPETGASVEWGVSTALLTHAVLLRRRADVCQEDCPWCQVSGHRHFLINIGRGFLGVLEQLADESDIPGERVYDFPSGSPRSEGPNLWRLGKTGLLMSAYLPAKLGDPNRCGVLSPTQHRLLQAIVRESTRRPRDRRSPSFKMEIIQQRQVPDLSGRGTIECDGLASEQEYVTFGGNRKRKGCGYLLFGEYGWLSKAGYSEEEPGVRLFFSDLRAISEMLGLVVVGLRKSGSGHTQWLTFDQIRSLLADRRSCRWLREIHLRIYTLATFEEQWGSVFQSSCGRTNLARPQSDVIVAALDRHGITRKELAQGIRQDYSLVCKILKGKRRCNDQFIQDLLAWIEQHVGKNASTTTGLAVSSNDEGDEERIAFASHHQPQPLPVTCFGVDMLSVALDYRRRGWSIVPQAPEAKQPWVKWKPYQERLPGENEIRDWYTRWPDSGIAVVLGPVSDLFVVDVDGPEAHDTLVERLGLGTSCTEGFVR